jgi:hypothetical protein
MSRKLLTVLTFCALSCLLLADANGQLFRRRARTTCSTGACQKVTYTSAVQKADEGPTQKAEETATQKSEAVQKTDATQKGSNAVNAVVVTQGSHLYNLCLRKAQWQAARGRVGHPGWGLGGCRCEGAGSGMTAQAALNACCYTGQRRVAASAVVRGANGRYYATKLYW